MNPKQVVKFIHSSFNHELIHSINNFVKTLEWEGENSICSVLPHYYSSIHFLWPSSYSETITKE